MMGDSPKPMEAFETWLLRRVAQAVEAGEVPAALLAELKGEFEAARAMPAERGHARAVESLADVLEIPLDEASQIVAELEAPPVIIREWQMRQIAEAWLDGQRGRKS